MKSKLQTKPTKIGALLVVFAVTALFSFSTIEAGEGPDGMPASTTVQASFSSGSGNSFLGVDVSDHGNLVSFESPSSAEAVFGGQEGYAVCSAGGATVHGYDVGPFESGFGAPTIVQPNPGAFPLTVTRTTTDGNFQLKQVWTKDSEEKDVTVTMTLKNVSATTISDVQLSRSGDFDVGTGSSDQGARTGDSAWQWDDVDSTTDSPPVGARLTALSFSTSHSTHIESQGDWFTTTHTGCSPIDQTTPAGPADLAPRVIYNLGAIGAGASKTVKYLYGRI